MSIFFEDHKNIFELLKEDDGSDIINGGDAGAADADTTADNGGGDADASSTTDNNTDNGDENFDIDTSLDDNNSDDSTNDDNSEDSDLDTGSDSSSGLDSGDTGEANPVNKDLFPTLTAEEQAIKIKELKKQYNDMYIYIDDLIDKISDVSIDEDNAVIIERISKNLFRLRNYLQEYISTTFNMKDYFENDVFFRRFLQVIYSIDSTMQDLAKGRAKKLGLKDDESEKK